VCVCVCVYVCVCVCVDIGRTGRRRAGSCYQSGWGWLPAVRLGGAVCRLVAAFELNWPVEWFASSLTTSTQVSSESEIRAQVVSWY